MTRRFVILSACAGALLLAGAPEASPDAAPGFTAADLAAAATGARNGEERGLRAARAILAQTETLRAALMLNPDAAMAALPESERAILAAALGPDDGALSARLGWFARSAVVRVAPGAGLGAAGLYNPIADAWLLVRWDALGGALRLTEAAVADGPQLRPARDGAFWIEAGAGDARALAAQRTAAFAAFDRVFRRGGDAIFDNAGDPVLSGRAAVWAKCDRWLAGLAAWGADPARAAQVRRTRAALTEGPASAAGRRLGLPNGLDALPPRLRATMAPVAAWETPGGAMLLFASPLSARHALLMRLGGEDTQFTAVDFDAAPEERP